MLTGTFLPQANLVASYQGDSLNDLSGNARTLTDNNGVRLTAYGFDFGAANTNKFLTINNNIVNPAADHSISLWAKVITPPATSEQRFVGVNKNQATGYIFILYREFGSKVLRINNSNGNMDYTVDLGTSLFHHIVYTCASGTMTLYLDGVQVGTPTARSTDVAGVDLMHIGAKNDGTSPASAIINRVGFFTSALTADQVKRLYRQGFGRQTTIV